MGNKFRKFKTKNQNITVMAFAFLFNFNRHWNNTKVTMVPSPRPPTRRDCLLIAPRRSKMKY